MIELLHSDLGLSVHAHPFKTIFELFHVKTSLIYGVKQKTEIVTYLANLVIMSTVRP